MGFSPSVWCVFAVLAFVTAEGPRANDCVATYTYAEPGCNAIAEFAQCLASATDSKIEAEKILSAAQEKTTGCDITVAPSIRVVDRELRVVTQEDVRFSRFRRDDVGVFELKGMIEANTDRIADAESLLTDTSDAITASTDAVQAIKDTTDAHATKIDAGLAAAVENIGEVDAKVDAAVAKLNAKIKAEAEEAEAAAAQEVEVAASWQYLANPIHPTNRRDPVDILVVGKNFGQYDYTPHLAPFIECTFTLSTDNTSTIVTAGKTTRITYSDAEPSYTVMCPSPVSIEKKTTFQLSIVWLGRDDPVAIPFNGAEKKDLITFDMTWSAINSANNDHLIVDVDGLDTDKKYTCKFTQADNEDITKSADGAFLGDKGRKMDCGAQPTGFAISDDNTAAVVFELFIKGTKTKASYAGPSGGGPTVKLDTCKNGEKDGDETDDDCGGGCGGCPPNSACKVDDDCESVIPCVDNVCGLDGLTQATAGKTCKAIVLQIPDSKNGFYWVTGPHGEFTKKNGKGPKKVMCWQEDRDGGGWTLATKHWYGQHHTFGRDGGRRQINNINSGVMAFLGQYYKLDDIDIRTYLGQPNPTNDGINEGGHSMMSFMQDKNGHDSRGSSSNREYSIMKKYTARWNWYTWSVIKESSTTSELSVYYMDAYDGGLTSSGEGELNWRGNPVCNNHGGTGINCYGTPRSGSPNRNPNGGHGCKKNMGTGWSGALHWVMTNSNYDTYFYMCSGHGASSHNRYSSRIWIRSPDSNEEW